jgi:hypothetical protein
MIACKNCRHVIDDGTEDRTPCGHPKAVRDLSDFLTGRSRVVQMSIESMRTIGDCGPDAKLFEAKER